MMKHSDSGRFAAFSLAALLMAFPISGFAGGTGSVSDPYTGSDVTSMMNKAGSSDTPVHYSISSGDTTGITPTSDLYFGFTYTYNVLTINAGSTVTCATFYDGVGLPSSGASGGHEIVTLTGSGSADTSTVIHATVGFTVGNYGSDNRFYIYSGADVTAASGIYIGNGFASSSDCSSNADNGLGYGNSAYVDGEGSTLSGSLFYVGQYGCHNSLYVTNGGNVSASSSFVVGVGSTSYGAGVTGSFNSLILGADGATGDAASVTATGSTTVGQNGSHNDVTIQSGANLFSKSFASIGGGNTNSTNAENGYGYANRVMVKGSGSAWTVANGATYNSLTIGNYGSSNSLIVSGGGKVENGAAMVGSTAFSKNNLVVVSGAGSEWINHGKLTVGGSGEGSVIIDNGALVMTGSIGYGATTPATVLLSSASLFDNGGNSLVTSLLTTDTASTSFTANLIYLGSGSYLAVQHDLTNASNASTLATVLSGLMVYDASSSSWVSATSGLGASLLKYGYVDGSTYTSLLATGGTYATGLNGYTVFSYSSSVPEPSTCAFFGGLCVLASAFYRRRK